MAEAHEIVHQVLDAFKGLAVRLERITGKTSEWFSSHGREPKTRNPLQTGNPSPVTHYMQYVRQFEAGEKGAGQMLNHRVHAELDMEFADARCTEIAQKEWHNGVLKESFDVLKNLNECNFADADLSQLKQMEEEGAELRDVASDYVSHIRAIRRQRENKNL
jgi:hypothetical protein